jgi:glycine/D-amino acid oxidase-like deaminating enzyme
MTNLETEVLVIGSGAGGAVTAAILARAGRRVVVVEEGPWVDPDALEPFSLEEMVAKYRHRGLSAALGSPTIAFAEGRCVGGSTEINSGLWHRLPPYLADEWRRRYRIEEFSPETLDRYAETVERELSVSRVPGAPPPSSAVLERGATKLGWRNVEFSRVFRYDTNGRGVKQTMTRTLVPSAIDAGASLIADCRVSRLLTRGGRVIGARCRRRHAGGAVEQLTIRAEHVFVCGGAIQTPALLQRSGVRGGVGAGLKLHPTIKIAARFPQPLDHDGVPMHRITEFAPNLTIGGSASRRGHVAMALAESSADYRDALANWEHVLVYYAAIRSDAGGRVVAVPGARAPLVTYRLTEADMSRLARGLVHLGEVLLAAGRRSPQRGPGRVVGRRHPAAHQPHDRAHDLDRADGRGARPHGGGQLRAGVGLPEPARQRRLAPARRAGCQPAVGDDGDRSPQRRTFPRGDLRPTRSEPRGGTELRSFFA